MLGLQDAALRFQTIADAGALAGGRADDDAECGGRAFGARVVQRAVELLESALSGGESRTGQQEGGERQNERGKYRNSTIKTGENPERKHVQVSLGRAILLPPQPHTRKYVCNSM